MTCSCDPVQLLTFIRISIASSLQSQFPLFESERESRPAMTLSVARQRRPRAEDQGASSSSSSASDRYWKEEKEKERAGVGWFLPSLLLGFLRHMSASSDIIHDCESATRSSITGNPSLHHLLYISGFQTWEYRNGFNNFNFCFVLALLFMAFVPIVRRKHGPELLIVVSPMYIWLTFLSLQAHKEERFLYPIYPLICIAATVDIDSFPGLFRDKYAVEDSLIVMIAKGLRPIFLGIILCASHSRTFSILNGYSAPLEIYKHLDHHDVIGNGKLRDIKHCTFFVELDLRRPYPARGSDLSTWETVAAIPFLDRELSPTMFRSFFIPYKWTQQNTFGLYKLLKKIPKSVEGHT